MHQHRALDRADNREIFRMYAYAFNNGVAYLLLALGRENMMLTEMIGNRTVYTLVYVLSLLVFLVSGYMVWRALAMLSRKEKNSRAA